MKKFEHEGQYYSVAQFNKAMKTKGSEGWEMVGWQRYPENGLSERHYVIWKREVIPKEAPEEDYAH